MKYIALAVFTLFVLYGLESVACDDPVGCQNDNQENPNEGKLKPNTGNPLILACDLPEGCQNDNQENPNEGKLKPEEVLACS